MRESTKCPICGKEGIPNFRKEDVVCPCCNSDLTVYHKIDGLIGTENTNNKTKKYKGLIFFLGILSIFVIGICIWFFILMANNSYKVLALEKEVKCLSDSINSLHQKIVQQDNPIDTTGEDIIDYAPEELYIVKRGDSFCKISKNILGSESRYREIINLNNLNVSTILHEGDTLKIPAK
ncbi:MAG: LysM peptidoglycan-binding domain-containing protein [Muribaculaceae bacterium]|nr:LysM peptidoglycan-binding domain-containing protein [Muribaculaceae bacterium]